MNLIFVFAIDFMAKLPLGWMAFLVVAEQAYLVGNLPLHKRAPNTVLAESPG